MFTILKQLLCALDQMIGEDRQRVLERIIASSATCTADVDRMVRQFEREGSNSFV
jgi:hypothetical protein